MELDTVIVPARPDGFQKVFIEQHAWWSIALSAEAKSSLKYIAIYQVAPISAITHYAKISRFEKYKNTDRYAIYFDSPPMELRPIKYDSGAKVPQSSRYSNLNKLLSSKVLSEVTGKKKSF